MEIKSRGKLREGEYRFRSFVFTEISPGRGKRMRRNILNEREKAGREVYQVAKSEKGKNE